MCKIDIQKCIHKFIAYANRVHTLIRDYTDVRTYIHSNTIENTYNPTHYTIHCDGMLWPMGNLHLVPMHHYTRSIEKTECIE